MGQKPLNSFKVEVDILTSLLAVYKASTSADRVKLLRAFSSSKSLLPVKYLKDSYCRNYFSSLEQNLSFRHRNFGYFEHLKKGGQFKRTYSSDAQVIYRFDTLNTLKRIGVNLRYPMTSIFGFGTSHPTVPGYPQYGYPMRTSPNDVVNGSDLVSPWDAAMWDHPLDPDVCRNLGGLTASQKMLCTRNIEVVGAAAIGLGMAVRECRRQFANHRWNCTALTTHTNNPSSAPIMQRGYSESAFGHAITAAGVTHAVARACSAGRLGNCSCGQVRGRRAWKWSGCHDNTRFGARFSRQFLDIVEKAKDIVSFTHIFNNEVGRKVVRRNREVRCKCHGMSGSCEMRTCWKAAPDFRHVGDILKKKYEVAKSAAAEVFGDAANSARRYRPVRRQITPESPLLYVERSPTYCSSDDRLDVEGTLGRLCNHTSTGADSCTTICCGRGYSLTRQKVTKKCNCRFKWCCDVTCQDCSEERWIAICK
ncbi:unnamed protein product, partial [Meganyctiphanes norvegica]